MISACSLTTPIQVSFTMYGEDAPQYAPKFVKDHGGCFLKMSADLNSTYHWKMDVEFYSALKAALFITAISNDDPERAAMFKMFWGGSE